MRGSGGAFAPAAAAAASSAFMRDHVRNHRIRRAEQFMGRVIGIARANALADHQFGDVDA